MVRLGQLRCASGPLCQWQRRGGDLPQAWRHRVGGTGWQRRIEPAVGSDAVRAAVAAWLSRHADRRAARRATPPDGGRGRFLAATRHRAQEPAGTQRIGTLKRSSYQQTTAPNWDRSLLVLTAS